MSGCPDCEELPEALPDDGVLYLSPPLDHTSFTLRGIFESQGLNWEEHEEGVYRSEISRDQYADLGAAIDEELSHEELEDTRSLFLEEDRELGMQDFAQMISLGELVGQFQGEWILDVIRDRQFTSFFHPIVTADNPSSIFGYEALLRGLNPDGSTIAPAELFPTAERMNLMFNLDREARISAIRSAVEHGLDEKVFINFNPASIYDPAYCLRTTFEAIEDTDLEANQVVFEVIESEDVMDRDQLIEIISHYRDSGFRVALDDVGEGYSSLGMLNELKPDFLKIDMNLVQGIAGDSFKAGITNNLLETARELDIRVIAEGVETREDVEWFRDHGADYLQGFYFARPDTPPPAVNGQ